MLLGIVGGCRADRTARREGPFRSLEDFARRTGLGPAGDRAAGQGRGLRLAAARPPQRPLGGAGAGPERIAAVCGKGEGRRGRGTSDFGLSDFGFSVSPFPLLSSPFPSTPFRKCLPPKRCWPITARPGCRCGGIRWSSSARDWQSAAWSRPNRSRPCPTASPSAWRASCLVRQRPSTAKGITFVTLEDETGTANLIVRPAVWRRCRAAAAGATLLLAEGPLQSQGEVIHVLTTKLEDLSGWLRQLGSQSRDFC